MQVKGAVAIITGAASGIGLGIARALAGAGWRLALVSRDLSRAAGFGVMISSGSVLAIVGVGGAAALGGAIFYLVGSTLACSALFLLAVGDLEQNLVITQAQGPLHLVDEFVLETLEEKLFCFAFELSKHILEQHFEVDAVSVVMFRPAGEGRFSQG